ncbi:hypothetical protein ACFL54_00660 [Planctomycetota bacterium]
MPGDGKDIIKKPVLRARVHLALSLLVVIAFCCDSLSTLLANEMALESNPLVNALPEDAYIPFTIVRTLAALVLLYLILPRKLQARKIPASCAIMLLAPLPYQRPLLLVPLFAMCLLIVLKLAASFSNIMILYTGKAFLVPLKAAWQPEIRMQALSVYVVLLVLSYLFTQLSLWLIWSDQEMVS